ncbi:hypothetical protein BASA50_006239 [Batrachochytrium salamandrivorans]|uniref:SWIM-type domain-containing protein n=1 Tax=Batrachochytrium salamandrivorans TaxID=1357716 RepID=A0ABQ8FAG9_9FUNG|nr:hypothetical protein BASA62_010188 [Batrachochytrium salamandrivorans]KAH6572248.1 hypothetical protein BASA60_006702 [Batrachochytrium salamandrivorans]KAH6587183.1 hypothetical protein BASA61_006372 [Batrachochytrium salamandrivorans]KAH6594887.1 hypothetical protein BASA50_006239 [Batrachochytrium salamandrivorans]KAH9249792.1 hypothetical protein BASA81_012470 [Batrachochytrium salamandrivorans]
MSLRLAVLEQLSNDVLLDDNYLSSLVFLCGEDKIVQAASIVDSYRVERLTVSNDSCGRHVYTIVNEGTDWLCLLEQNYCSCNQPDQPCVHLLAVHLAKCSHQIHDKMIDRDRYLDIITANAY